MRKWLVLHPAIWAQLSGGAEQQIAYLVNYLLENGVEVHYIFEDKGIPFPQKEKLHLHPISRKKSGRKLGNNWFLYRRAIERLLSEVQPDIVYTRLYSSWSFFASEYAKREKKLHIWALSSDRDVTRMDEKVSWHKPFSIYENQLVRQVFKKDTLFVVQNNYQLAILNEKWGINAYKLNQSAPLPYVSIYEKEAPLLVVWVAHLKPLKRPEFFLNLVKACSSEKRLYFTMVGRGGKAYEKEIDAAQKINSRFNFIGEQTQEDVSVLLEKAHVLINTSEYEGFPNTFVQAWMRGVVVVSMQANPDGLLDSMGDKLQLNSITEIKEKLVEWAENSEKWAKLANAYQNNARLNHAIEHNLSLLFKYIYAKGNGR